MYFVSGRSDSGGTLRSSEIRTTLSLDGSIRLRRGSLYRLPAPIGRQLHRVTIAASKRLVDVQQALHPVFACGNVRQCCHRIAEHITADECIFARLQAVDVDAEYLLGPVVVCNLEPRLLRGIG